MTELADRIKPDQTGAETWRYRCPEGHTTITERQKGTIYCETCVESYPLSAKRDLKKE